MGEHEITKLWKECADLFYENSEQAAYETLASLLPELNAQLQELASLLAGLPDGAGDVMQQKVFAGTYNGISVQGRTSACRFALL